MKKLYYSGFGDEAARDIASQIKATRELGWSNIEARSVDGQNINDLPEAEFEAVAKALDTAGVRVDCLGSAVANWGRSIHAPFEATMIEAQRAVRRMARLKTREIRVMSYGILRDRSSDNQMEEERFRRLRELLKLFADAGITMLHENCENYGGMGWQYTLRLVENVPGLKLVFDPANAMRDVARGEPEPKPRQSAWMFYKNVRPHIARVHIKDGIFLRPRPSEIFDEVHYTWPGEGHADVWRILYDLVRTDYTGALSIEPHLSDNFSFLDPKLESRAQQLYAGYVAYGRRLMELVASLQSELGKKAG
jgi:sugar phosphate isomerase/epimerase